MKKQNVSNFYLRIFSIILLFLGANYLQAQTPKGKLFIIGGGNRSDELMKQVLAVAELAKKITSWFCQCQAKNPTALLFSLKNKW
ncbi:hypothetical protein ACQ9BO_21380 [Flavobacterium sp. P21]|uniref:hypothetical protein n=1 Tax=Flavobacterium sp. P21 TaxID=3423948 RepID=UPI003D66F448